MNVAVIIPTFNGRKYISRLLDSLHSQRLNIDIFIVDSSSSDGTLNLVQNRVANIDTISSSHFNHGGTRQMMIENRPEYEFYVLMTQDTYLEDEFALEHLVAPFMDSMVGVVCGRQLPHHDADPWAQHARLFNYPVNSITKSLSDAPMYGLKTAFVSNSFSAYRGAALNSVGGFPKQVILSEDMFVAAKMLLSGWRVAYAGDAKCRHSHNYTLVEEFRRYFDQGVFHGSERWISEHFGGAGGEGIRFVRSELRYFGLSKLHLWPATILRSACKFTAFKLGQNARMLPLWLKKNISMNRGYWSSTNGAGG